MKTQQTFVVCLLLAAAGMLSAQVPTGPTDLDHFNCYEAAPPQGHQPIAALLQDEFDVSPPAAVFLPPVFEQVTDLSPSKLCNPVTKVHNGATTGELHPDAHLLMYWINNQPSTPRSVTVENQFGVATLTTGPAVILAVPSTKVVISSPTTTPSIPVIERELDHFKCYMASGDPVSTFTGAPVFLTDQFITNTPMTVFAPWLFCNPVKKWRFTLNPSFFGSLFLLPTITGENHPEAHLTCYVTELVPGQNLIFPPPVIYNNQFVPPGTVNSLVLSGPDLLCVPSFKLGWNVIPAPSTGP